MKDIAGRVIRLIVLFLLMSPLTLKAQMLRDSASLDLIKKSIENIYNLRFGVAREDWSKLNLSYPGHPVVHFLKGMITYWENFPLLPLSAQRVSFENDLRTCIELCEGKHNPADAAELLLANLSARGLLLLFYTDNDINKEVVPLAISTYRYIRRSFDYTSSYNDFYFFTGLYNYYRVAYPEAYPAYKTVALLFPKGDRMKGLNYLHMAASSSLLFKAEASSFLSVICLSFENNFQQAYEHSEYLHELYPSNIQYLSMFIKNLLLIKRYDDAESHIKYMDSLKGNFYNKAQLAIYNGILQEKKYHNIKMAEQFYLEGIRKMSTFGYFGTNFVAYGYFGLSRISKLKNDESFCKTYLKKALELADFKNVDFN